MICSVLLVQEGAKTFTFQIFDTKGKKRKTFFHTGKYLITKEDLMQRMVNRKEFEADQEPEEVGRGQVIRVRLHTEVSDSTGFVLKVENGYVFVVYFWYCRRSYCQL